MSQEFALRRRVLVYIPAYNCRDHVVRVIQDIPAPVRELADVLVVDNCSPDGTADVLRGALERGELGTHITVIQPPRNLGYAGSQKLAYSLALAQPSVEWVMMLHGDGQYPAELLVEYLPHLQGDAGVVYGFRDKRRFGPKEETPAHTFLVIRLLSALESLVTGYWRQEWHSGFVMYHVRFLRQVNLAALTPTPHIDGHLQLAAGVLGVPVRAIPIWKRYRDFHPFGGSAAIRYVLTVLGLLVQFGLHKNAVRLAGAQQVDVSYRVVAGREQAPT